MGIFHKRFIFWKTHPKAFYFLENPSTSVLFSGKPIQIKQAFYFLENPSKSVLFSGKPIQNTTARGKTLQLERVQDPASKILHSIVVSSISNILSPNWSFLPACQSTKKIDFVP
jgi:hypothetical protein